MAAVGGLMALGAGRACGQSAGMGTVGAAPTRARAAARVVAGLTAAAFRRWTSVRGGLEEGPEAMPGATGNRGAGRTANARRAFQMAGVSVLLVLAVAACTASPDTAAGHGVDDAGFWLGLWQGLIAPIAFVVSLFNHSVGIYEVHNNGAWYNFGFLVGVSIFFSGSGAGARRSSGSSRRSR